MIILTHLTVERFRLLREINLHFPQRGSILIQGPNEAGKSALLEAIGFTLYGIASPQKLDELILYGASSAMVTLTLSVGATELQITRTIQRGQGQQASLIVRRLGTPDEEPITHVAAVNERIISELGYLDSDTLRNSCFVEQKGLHRLEQLNGLQREISLRKLLGLEKLMRLTEQFKVDEQDEQLLQDSAQRLQLAQVQAHIPELSTQLAQLEAALDALTVLQDLTEIRQQEEDIAEQEQSLEHLQEQRTRLKGQQARVQQLKKAETIVGHIIDAYDAMAEAQSTLPQLERDIAELDRREREELPALEKRVHDLADLTLSFATLERLSNDLLSSVTVIKHLQTKQQQQTEEQDNPDNLEALDERIIHARLHIDSARQAQQEREERRRAGRPQLEARLQRLRGLMERLVALRQKEQQCTQAVLNRRLAEENSTQIEKATRDLKETEQEFKLVEAEAKQTQQHADTLEKRWRQLSIRRQLEEWQRLKGLMQGLGDAEQHVMAAHRHQGQLTTRALASRAATTRWLLTFIGCLVLALVLAGGAVYLYSHQTIVAATMGIIALLAVAGMGWSWQHYAKARKQEAAANQEMQQAIKGVSMMVAAREAAARMLGNADALTQIEYEIQSLGGTVPRSLQEAQDQLQHIADSGESLADIQQQMTEKRDSAAAMRNQVNVTMEAQAALRKEQARLRELRQRQDWDSIEEKISTEQTALELLEAEISALVGQEGLPLPSFEPMSDPSVGAQFIASRGTENGVVGSRGLAPAMGDAPRRNPGLETLVEDSIKATEREIAALDGKLDLAAELATQHKDHEETLDSLLLRKRLLMERREQAQSALSLSPTQQLERAQEQQAVLRDALRTLQDSLRQRVKPLGVGFGQTAISSAEATARKQLEALHVTLDHRVELQSRRTTYSATLKERQESLSEHYQQLAKFSGTLGSWIVPLNPFAEALVALRQRCLRELQEADESDILQKLEQLQAQEGASKAKIALCHQEIEEAQERIATMLVQHHRPTAKSYTLADVAAVWPLIASLDRRGEGGGEGMGAALMPLWSPVRTRLQEERALLEKELHALEQQDLHLSQQLPAGSPRLDLDLVRQRMEQQERKYQTKKRGNLLVKAVSERMMHKIILRTEYYMQHILPLLTSGRYHDIRLTTESEEGTASGGPFQLRVWDTAANSYVPTSALSGGTADQVSLALRLAFAIAALPRELSAAPGFLLLDEPLSSFDPERAKTLVDVVTGEMLGQHFEQILFISHSTIFDPALFPYHISMEGGAIVESNLPVVGAGEVLGASPAPAPTMTPPLLTPVSASIAVE